jgi:hypothetical protein
LQQRGFSSSELLEALALGAITLTISVLALSNTLRGSRVEAAAQHVVNDLREARSQAILRGWEYRVMGYNAGTSNARENQYRVLARRSSSASWPADSSAPFSSATQFAGEWIEVDGRYPGVRVTTTGASPPDQFGVTFDSRGAATELGGNFSPFEIAGDSGASKVLRVSPTGQVSVQ